MTPLTDANRAQAIAAKILARIRRGDLDPRRAAEHLGLPFDQDDITAILELAVHPAYLLCETPSTGRAEGPEAAGAENVLEECRSIGNGIWAGGQWEKFTEHTSMMLECMVACFKRGATLAAAPQSPSPPIKMQLSQEWLDRHVAQDQDIDVEAFVPSPPDAFADYERTMRDEVIPAIVQGQKDNAERVAALRRGETTPQPPATDGGEDLREKIAEVIEPMGSGTARHKADRVLALITPRISALETELATAKHENQAMVSDLAEADERVAALERENERLKDRAAELRDALHDLCMLNAQKDAPVPAPTLTQWNAAWMVAEDLVRVEP